MGQHHLFLQPRKDLVQLRRPIYLCNTSVDQNHAIIQIPKQPYSAVRLHTFIQPYPPIPILPPKRAIRSLEKTRVPEMLPNPKSQNRLFNLWRMP